MEVLESSSEGPIVQRPYLEGTRLEGGSSYSYPDTADRDTVVYLAQMLLVGE